ncbi:glycosyltransferase family 39 protein [Patescibacteria group bacterium]|nr:glycosyltransferase family 39 protein [Patescibacteria group bacterium]
MEKDNKSKLAFGLTLIILVAALLRVWRFNQIPPGLFGDEVDTGYQAYSIIKTGRDYFGNLLPIHFQSYGDWRMPLYIYLLSPLVGLFGPSELVTRLPSLIFSLLFIGTSAGVAFELTGKKKTALLTAGLVAFSSWQFHFSRLALEVTLFGWLFLAGVWFWLKKDWSEKKRLGLAGASWGLSVWAYSTAKLFLPLWLGGLFLLYRKRISKKGWIVLGLVFGLLVLPIGLDTYFGKGGARFGSISVFSEPVDLEVIKARTLCDWDDGRERVVHNKGWAWADVLLKNYLSSFSVEYLFLRGDPSPRHNPLEAGQLNPVLAIFIPLGMYSVVRSYRREKKPEWLLAFLVLFLTPLPAALTKGGGTHAIRTYQFLPWWQLLAAIGFEEVVRLVKKRWRWLVVGVTGAVYFVFSFNSFHQYFHHFNQIEWRRWWNEGYRQVFDYLEPRLEEYDEIWFSPAWEPPVVYTLFYSRYEPRLAQQELVISPLYLGRFVFLGFDLTESRVGLDKLLIAPPGEITGKGVADIENDPRFSVKLLVYNSSGELVFYIFQLLSLKQDG